MPATSHPPCCVLNQPGIFGETLMTDIRYQRSNVNPSLISVSIYGIPVPPDHELIPPIQICPEMVSLYTDCPTGIYTGGN